MKSVLLGLSLSLLAESHLLTLSKQFFSEYQSAIFVAKQITA